MNIDDLIKNPNKSETYDDLEKTIANQLARFTMAFTDSNDLKDSLKTVCALGFDLYKTCGVRVCEDTNMTFTHYIRKQSPEMAGQYQQITYNMNNNDVCVYLYLALPTISNDVSRKSLEKLCLDTIDLFADNHLDIRKTTMIQPNYDVIDTKKTKKLYRNFLKR